MPYRFLGFHKNMIFSFAAPFKPLERRHKSLKLSGLGMCNFVPLWHMACSSLSEGFIHRSEALSGRVLQPGLKSAVGGLAFFRV